MDRNKFFQWSGDHSGRSIGPLGVPKLSESVIWGLPVRFFRSGFSGPVFPVWSFRSGVSGPVFRSSFSGLVCSVWFGRSGLSVRFIWSSFSGLVFLVQFFRSGLFRLVGSVQFARSGFSGPVFSGLVFLVRFFFPRFPVWCSRFFFPVQFGQCGF